MKITSVIVAGITLVSGWVHANTSTASLTQYVWPSIAFIEGADLCYLKNSHKESSHEFRNKMVDDMLMLLYGGASGTEAIAAVLAFDELYHFHRETSKKRLGVSLEALVRGNLENFYTFFNPPERKIEFRHDHEVRQIIVAAKAGQRIGYLHQDSKTRLDYYAYGSFSMSAACNGSIDLNINLVSLANGKTQSFIASGAPHLAAYEVVQKIFDHFHKTKFPSTIAGIDGSHITVLGTPNGRLNQKVSWQTGERACRALGGRLPHTQEIKDIDFYGSYGGGISLVMDGLYLRSGQDNVFVVRWKGQEESKFSVQNDKEAYFFCVK